MQFVTQLINPMTQIRCAVIGVGYLGRFHAQKYQSLDNAELVAICDTDKQALDKVAKELNVPGYQNYHDFFDKVDAISIAATTNEHYKIALDCLKAGKHVLIEKPITETVEQAHDLVKVASENHCKLQVGHLERFNPARLALDGYLSNPLFIESNRLAPFNPRGTDVNVVLDLMIHDIDLILAIVQQPVIDIQAQGAPVLTHYPDIANARIQFANGCVANVTASRVSFKTERKMRLFQEDSYISIDYQNKEFAVFTKGKEEMFPGIPEIIKKQSNFEKSDALMDEISAFVTAILQDSSPLVTGEDGAMALKVASDISECISNNLAIMHP